MNVGLNPFELSLLQSISRRLLLAEIICPKLFPLVWKDQRGLYVTVSVHLFSVERRPAQSQANCDAGQNDYSDWS